jgi:TolB-like protein
MSELRAVFLSYASQDAESAKRICEALRAGGIEVWFDQSELRGGDAWDQRIRREVHDCALFIPIISANTASRHEGYFRLEWNLADQRTQMMARGRAFIIPVCIDSTPDTATDVPESFARVQWTRLPAGEKSPVFVARISQLLSPSEPQTPAQAQLAPGSAPSFRPSSANVVASRRSKLLSLLIAAVAFLAVSYIGWQQFKSRQPDVVPTVTAASAIVPATTPGAAEQSIAVMPFVNESSDKEQEYFADGLTDTMIDLLSKVPDLRVPARSSSFFFKGKNAELSAIAAKLHVSHVLEGTVRKAGNRLRVSAELVRADTGYHVWSETYDRDANDIFKVQDEISAAVVAALKLKLVAAGTNTQVRGTANPEAYDQFLIGSHYFSNLPSADNYRHAGAALRKALALDPAYADAATTLLLADALLADFTGDAAGLKRAIAAAERLPLAHPDHGPSYRMRADIRSAWQWDWAGAQADYEKALALDPTDADAYNNESLLLLSLGRFREANVVEQKALALDGLNLGYLGNLAAAQMSQHDYAAAEQTMNRMAEIDPRSEVLASSLSTLRLLQSRFAESLAECPKISDERTRLTCVAHAQHSLGHRTEADQALSALLQTGTGGNLTNLARAYAWRGQTDKAFASFDKAVAAQESSARQILADRTLDGLHQDPRWAALLKKMNLPN